MKITKTTIIRTVMILIVIINSILKRFGIDMLNITENEVGSVISELIEIVSIVTAWWYNNSFTDCARKADEFMKSLKEEEKENVQSGS